MNRCSLFACAFFCILCSYNSHAITLTAQQQQVVDRFVAHLIKCEFSPAFAITDSLSAADQSDPLGPLLTLFAYGMRDIDYDRTIDSVGLMQTYKVAVKKIADYEKAFGRSSHTMTLAGMANATHAAFYLRKGKYFSAIGTGLDALRNLHDAKNADSNNYDVDFFLGLYDYAKAELRKRLWMVLFWYGGDKEDGIRRLKDCVAHGKIASTAAKMSLADIYITEKRYDEARDAIDELLAEFPTSRFIMWTNAKYYEAIEQFETAAEIYRALSDSYAQSEYGAFNSTATYYRYIKTLCKAGRKEEATAAAKKMLSKKCRQKKWRKSAPCAQLRKDMKRLCDDKN